MTRPGEISRTALVAAVERAIKRMPQAGYQVSPADLRRVRRAARRMKRCLLGNWWSSQMKCGCVVGEAFPEHREALTSKSTWRVYGEDLYNLGVLIDQEIRGRPARPYSPYLRVRDR